MDTRNDFPAGWRPRPGDSIKGKIVDLSIRDGSEYADYPIVTVETADGEQVAVHAFHEVLRNELARRSPKLGDVIEIAYRGQHPDKGYHLYQVGGSGGLAFSWDRFSGLETASPEYANRGDQDDDVPF